MAGLLKELLGRLTRTGERGAYKKGLVAKQVLSLAGQYWKLLPTSLKINYLKKAMYLTRDRPNDDPHIGDATFQNIIIGSSERFSQFMGMNMSQYYTKGKFGYPDELQNNIEVKKGSYFYGELIKNTAKYQVNPTVPKSRARRYIQGKPKPIPVHPEAKALAFRHLDSFSFGIELIARLPEKEQEELILDAIPWGTSMGYPFHITQTRDNFKPYFLKFLKMIGFKTEKKEVYLTVQLTLKLLIYCLDRKLYFPFTHYERTQVGDGDIKHRSVFGGNMFMKLLGGVFGAGKHIGQKESAWNIYTQSDFTKHIKTMTVSQIRDYIASTKTEEKHIVDMDGVPVIGQLEWDKMFPILLDHTPSLLGDEVVPDGFDIFDADYSAYDTGIIYEDCEWLMEHPTMGIYIKYILYALKESEVWLGPWRLIDIFFKSGHPLTSDLGSFIHFNLLFNARDYARAKYDKRVVLKWFSVLSDDEVSCWQHMKIEWYEEYCKTVGMIMKSEDSHSYVRDRIYSYLKVLVGYPMNDKVKGFVGDPISRYLGLAHSERPLYEDEDSGEVKGDLTGIWKITGNVNLDAFLSKLASFGRHGAVLVSYILTMVKDTDLGRDAIATIASFDQWDKVKPYRSDIRESFPPSWLGGLTEIRGAYQNNRVVA